MKKGFLTTKEAAETLGISPVTLRRWDQSGKLRTKRNPFNNYRMFDEQKIKSIAKKLNSTK